MTQASLRTQLRRDVVCVPVLDAPPTRLLIAWPTEHCCPALAAFVRVATAVAAARLAAA